MSEKQVDDLTALVSRLARALRQAAPDHALPAQALDYLARSGVALSPLRGEPLSKDTIAVMEIDRVLLCAGQHWPDVEGEAMITRHVKQLTRMLNKDITEVQALKEQVRRAWLSGTDDFRRFYDAELFAVLGITVFQDLYPSGCS